VIDKKSLVNLPKVLFEASNMIWEEYGTMAVDLVEELRMYAVLIEAMPDD